MKRRQLFSKKNIAGLMAAVYAASSILSGLAPAQVLAAEEDVVIETSDEADTSDEILDESESADMELIGSDESGEVDVSGVEDADDLNENEAVTEVVSEEDTDEVLVGYETESDLSDDEEDVVEEAVEEVNAGIDSVTINGTALSEAEITGLTVTTEEGITTVAITKAADYEFSGSGSDLLITVKKGINVNLTLNDLTIDDSAITGSAFIEAGKDTLVNLILEGKSNLTGSDGLISQKKKDSTGSFLYIKGSGSVTVSECADDGIKSKGDVFIEDGVTVVIDKCGGDGIQGENVTVNGGDITIDTYYENAATSYYTSGKNSVEGYNTIWESGSTKTERVNVDTGSHSGIKAGTKAKTVTFASGDSDGAFGEAESSTASGGLTINGGNIKIDTTQSGIKVNGGVSGYTAAATGVYIIGSPDDALKSNNTLTINGGTIELAAGDDGITSAGALTVNGDTKIDITMAYEGMEGAEIVIGKTGDPVINIKSNDDGINSTSKTLTYTYDSIDENGDYDDEKNYYKYSVSVTNGTSCNIYGGSVQINIDSQNSQSITLPDGSGTKTVSYKSSGDGIDCNGTLDIEDGTVFVFGQSSGDNSPIDTNDGFTLGKDTTVLGTGVDSMNEAKPEAGDGVYITYGSSSGMGGPGSGSFDPRMGASDSDEDINGAPPTPPSGDFSGQESSSASISAGSKFTVSDGTNEIFSTTLPYSASFLIFGSPLLTAGNTYTLTIGDTTTTVTAMTAGSETSGGGSSGEGLTPPDGEQGGDGLTPPTPPSGDQTVSGDGLTPPDGQLPPDGQIPPDGVDGGSTVSDNIASVSSDKILVVKDKSLNIASILNPTGAKKIKYVVSSKAVAVNKKGQVKAKKAGEAVITSKIKVDKKWVDTGLSYKIIVEDPQVTTKKELKKGESINISDLIAASTTTFKAKDIAVKKSEIASVDSTGKITALAKGNTKITFTLGGRTYKIKLKVTE